MDAEHVDEMMRLMREEALERVTGMPHLAAIETLVADMDEVSGRARLDAIDHPSPPTFVHAVTVRAFTEGLRLAATLAHDRAWQ